MLVHILIYVGVLQTLLCGCYAWGNLGHRTVALLAAKQLTPRALKYMKDVLDGEAIDDAAIWPDSFKMTPEGAYTGSWHFVDAMDDPPMTCNVDFSRDCHPERVCIIAAFQNMTTQLTRENVSRDELKAAYSFIVHLIGDIHMPLHAEGLLKGGNNIKVLFDGVEQNLHFVWDVKIPQKITDSNESNEGQAASSWADSLWHKSWPNSPDTDFRSHLEIILGLPQVADLSRSADYALEWATEANRWICEYVLKDGTDSVTGKELSGDYYDGAVPIVENLIIQAASRLAMWTNALADV